VEEVEKSEKLSLKAKRLGITEAHFLTGESIAHF
jgi:hypothetical protein